MTTPAPGAGPKQRQRMTPSDRTVSSPRKMGRPTGDFSAHAEILAGAGQAFGAKGYADTTVEDILTAAKVSRRTFYRFFHNKDEVFSTLFDVAMVELLNAVNAAIAPHTDFLRKVEAGVEAYLRTQAAAGALGRVLSLEPLNPGSQLAGRYQETIHTFAVLVQREGERLQRRKLDPLIFRGLVAALESISITLQQEAAAGVLDIERGKRVMLRILGATLALPGETIPPLPTL